MQNQYQQVFPFREPDQSCPDQGASREIERCGSFSIHDRACAAFRIRQAGAIVQRHMQAQMRRNPA